MKVTFLGIGTELTEGQIINRNGPWISQKLKQYGLQTQLHLIVPDEHRLMRQGLDLCAQEGDLVFVTGGLGPTSDDFTRDIIGEWMGVPLQFHPPSWEHLNTRLQARGYKVQEIQKQQCYFPEGAQVLVNSEGTANAFYVEAHGKKVFVLPGPPREIEAVWSSFIDSWLQQNTRHLDPVLTRLWDTLGKGESEIATLAEEALQGTDVERGYRVHLPYVEVKLIYKKSEEAVLSPWIQKLDDTLKPFTITRDGEDIAMNLAEKIENFNSIKIIDTMTKTFLFHRLSLPLRSYMERKSWSFSNQATTLNAELELQILEKDAFSAEAVLHFQGKEFREVLESPYKTANMQVRAQQYLVEKALVFWCQKLA